MVVAGGDEEPYPSDVYNFETGNFRGGPLFPRGVTAAASVQYGDTFLVVGGLDSNGEILDTIYEYDALNEEWIEREEKLATPRYNLAAVLVDDTVAFCY